MTDNLDLDSAVWLRRDAIADGYTDRQIQTLVRSRVWRRIRRGAYCAAELWDQLDSADRHRLLCRAVLRTAHPTTVLSHVSAAIERGVPVWGVDLSEVHTTRLDSKSGRREHGVDQHRGILPAEHVEQLNGVPVTTAGRTLVELTTILDVESALVTAHGLINAGHTTLDEAKALAHDARFWPSTLTTRLVLGLVHPGIESPLESRAWYCFWKEHVPRPEPQVEVLDEVGHVVARVDFLWREAGVFLEADGREKYTKHRRQGESLDQFLMREKRREELICLLTGWTCIRISWRDLDDMPRLARRIRAVLRSRQQPA